MIFEKNRAETKIIVVQPSSKRLCQIKSNFFDGYLNKNLYCVENSVTQTSVTPPNLHNRHPLPWRVAKYLRFISNIKAKGINLTFTAQNMKESLQPNTQFHFHKNNLYVQTESRTFCNTKPDDTDRGFFSNRTVGHTTTSY